MKTFVLALCLVIAAGCATSSRDTASVAKPNLPEDWQRVQVDKISFGLPPGLGEVPGQALTGIIKQYQGAELQVTVHYGDFASNLREFEAANGSAEWMELDGRRARGTSVVADQKAYDGLFVPEPGKELQPLSILCVSLTPAARAQGMLVLQSVEFD